MNEYEYDEDEVAREEANYQTPTAEERRAFVREQIGLHSGESVLSIGCGPGFEPSELATDGQASRVTAIDSNSVMLSRAQERCPDEVSLLAGDATALPVGDSEFDVAVSVQVYEYIQDIGTALAELHRVLTSDGRAVIYATDWDSLVWHATNRERANRVLDAWMDHCSHPRLGSELNSILTSTSFDVVDVIPFPILLTKLGNDSYAHYLLKSVQEFVAPKVGQRTVQQWVDDLRALDEDGKTVFSLCQFCYVVKPA